MKSFFRKIPRPPLIIVIILLTAAILLACGPATQSAPEEQPGLQPAQEKSTPEPTNTPEPTPPPTDIITRRADSTWKEIVQWVPPKSPRKYPAMDNTLESLVEELEEAEDQDEGNNSGARGQQETVEDSIVAVTVHLTANTLTVDEWVRSKGFTTANVREFDDGSGGRFSASVPLSLLAELAAQEGVSEIKSITHRPTSVDKE